MGNRPPIITVSEGMEIPFPPTLSVPQLKADLLRLNERSNTLLFRFSKEKIFAGEVVGCVQFRNIRLNILPKVQSGSIEDQSTFLLNVLHKAGYFRRSYESDGNVASTARDPLESIITELAEAIATALSDGLPRRYQHRRDYLPAIRGKIDFNELSKSCRADGLLPVVYGELGKDNLLSRCIKAVCQNLLSLTRSENNRRTLARILTEFDFISAKLCSVVELENVHLTPTEQHWGKPLQLIKLLIQEKAINPTFSGKTSAFCLLFPMATVYEKALRNLLREITGYLHISLHARNISTYLLEDQTAKGILQLRPDYVFHVRDKLVAVGDAKWKRVSELARANGIDRNDLYQIVAYLHRYAVNSAIIFVPTQAWMTPNWHQTYRLQNTSLKIHVVGVDILALVNGKKSIRDLAKDNLLDVITPFISQDEPKLSAVENKKNAISTSSQLSLDYGDNLL